MSFYKDNKNEITTMHLLSQILGKIKLEYAAQEPQWAHIILDITAPGFSTGLLKLNEIYFQIEVDLRKSVITIKTDEEERQLALENGKTIQDYYLEITKTLGELGLSISINTKPQEMLWKKPFEEDVEHHHYKKEAAKEMVLWFQFAWEAQQEFIAPLRQRKVYPGLFWGTFDVSCIVVYNQFEAFEDDSKVIERAAFDEHMIEVGFWLGDDNFDYPTLFTLPYPFVSGVKLEVDESFPVGSYFSSDMAEYLYEFKEGRSFEEREKALAFMLASFKKSKQHLKWEKTEHFFEALKMNKNQK